MIIQYYCVVYLYTVYIHTHSICASYIHTLSLTQEADAHNDKVEPQGTIRLRDIKQDCGLEVDDNTHEITVNTATKAVHLKASSQADAMAWVTNITAWMESTAGANV